MKIYKTNDGVHDINFEKLLIVRADPIKNVNRACVRNLVDPLYKNKIVDIAVVYDAVKRTMTFSPSAPVTLKQFDVLYFGTESDDFIFCEDNSFQYKVTATTTPKAGVTQKALSQMNNYLPDMTVTEYMSTDNSQARYLYDFLQDASAKALPAAWPKPFKNPLGLTIPAELQATKEEFEAVQAVPVKADTLYGFDYQIDKKTVVSTTGLPFTMARMFNRLTMNIFAWDGTDRDSQIWGLGEQVTD